ncbi:MAG: transporter substrate-binding domain-containing protein, partial [Lachnospiraceae bacterium]|nr:transporter substrate-binding domain-containing protein [Lachnospiraceae bacterium]
MGYYENEVFQEGAAPGAVKTGYAYEYYRKLSEYTGWEYEYVYGSYSDLYDMLLDGRIDLLAGLAKREDRLDIIGYPSLPMGNEIYTLVKHDDDTQVTAAPSTLSGRRFGVLRSAIADVLREYLEENGIKAEVVCFNDYESLFSAFDIRKIDILAAEGDGAYGRDFAEVVCTFGTSDYYLCVSKDRTDLLGELEEAQSHLAAEEPGYIAALRNKYYSASVSSHSFSAAEREWIAENRQLRVGYLDHYLPYSATAQDGTANGIIRDIIPQIFTDLSLPDIQVTYTGFENYDDMIAAVGAGRIDLCFPVGGGLYYSEESGIYQSSPVASASTDLVYRGEYDEEDIRSFAVNENNRMQYYYIRTQFPEAQITYYPDMDACLKAVLKGEVGATTLNGLSANEILKNSKYKGLYLQQLSRGDDRCFGVKIGNEGLLKLLNRGIKVLGSEYSHELAAHYSAQLYTYTFGDLFRDNLWLFLTISLFVAVFIIVLVFRDLRRTRVADRMKTDFVSNMSHEIRTPITAIIGMNEMIRRDCGDENVRQYSDNIEKAGESLLGIINDILDFSKIEAGHMEVSNLPYSMEELLRDLHVMIEGRAREKGLTFRICADESLPSRPVGDMQKLRQVITNLLTNAVKYTEKGSVTLTVKLLSSEKESFVMEVSVEDTGIGIKDSE